MNKSYVVGIDIGGQTAKIGIVDASGNVLSQPAAVGGAGLTTAVRLRR